MGDVYSFGEWIKQRRLQLRLTQREVAARAFCSTAMIKKMEADERQPSPELAQSLAAALDVTAEDHQWFIAVARGERPVDRPVTDNLDASLEDVVVHHPPLPTTPFIGRARELADVTAMLQREEVRLVTLVGPGGMGKTRLAVEAARAVQDDFEDGVVFVPLAAVDDVEQLPQAIAQKLQSPLSGGEPIAAQLQRVLRRRQLLLLLDNFEQLVQGAALLADWLAAAPGVKVVVTSRERLNLAQEWLFVVPALDEAVSLFTQTALRVKADFDAAAEEEAVAHICQLVGGHPLAIELAASWRRFMPCADIAARIRQDIDFLDGGPRDAPDRHRSMRALFDHSWALLSSQEQEVLPKLSVFRGGFAAEQADAVAGAGWSILSGLVDKSLLKTDGDGRFDLHDLTRQYAGARLTAMDQTEIARRAHFETYLHLAQQLNEWYTGPRAEVSFGQAEREHDNFRTALAWALDNQPGEAVLELAHGIFLFWLRGGYWQEGEQWLKAAIARTSHEESVSLCLALAQLGAFLGLQGRFSEGYPITQQAYHMARRLEDPWALVVNLQILGQALPDTERALAAFEEAITICRKHMHESRFNAFLGSLLGLKGDRLMTVGLFAEARVTLEASLSHLRALGDTFWIAYPLGNLGRIALHDGRLQEAYDLVGESVAIAQNSGNRVGIADWLFRLGQVHLYRGELDAAEANLWETLRLYEEVGNTFGPPGVLSNLALVALEREGTSKAVSLIQESFSRYQSLQASARKVDMSSDFLEFGDAIDSLLHAALVAHAQGDCSGTVTLLAFLEKNVSTYEAVRPLQEKVAATRAQSQSALSPTELAAAITRGERMTLDELLASWFA